MYIKKMAVRRPTARRRGVAGFGGFGDDYGDPMAPTCPTGQMWNDTTGGCVAMQYVNPTPISVVTSPVSRVTPTPAPSSPSAFDAFFRALAPTPGYPAPGVMPGMTIMPQSGISTTTAVALAGGALLLAVLLSR